MSEIPDGYPTQETVRGTGSLVKVQPRVIRESEEELVRDAVRRVAGARRGDVALTTYEVEVRGEAIVVHEGTGIDLGPFGLRSPAPRRLEAMLRFEVVDPDERAFQVRRMTWRGNGGWS